MASSIRDIIANSVAEVTDGDALEPLDIANEDFPDADTEEIPDEPFVPDEALEGDEKVVVADDKVVEPTDEEKAATAAAAKAKEVPAEDPFAKEHDLKAVDKNGKPNRIPYPRVVKITENAVIKSVKPFVDAGWVKADAKPAEIVQAVVERVNEYEGRLKTIHKTETIMLGDSEKRIAPDEVRFLKMLAGAQGTKYAQLLEPAFAALRGEAPKVVEAAKAMPATAEDPEPKPDVDLGNGQVGYSPEQHAKLRAWDRRESVRVARGELTNEFKPIKNAFDAHQSDQARATKAQQTLDAAYRRPGFRENVDAIYKEFMDNGMDLDAAYDKVLYGKASAPPPTVDEAAMRAKWLKELRGAPKSTSAGGSSISAAEAKEVADEAEAKANPVRAAITASIRRKA